MLGTKWTDFRGHMYQLLVGSKVLLKMLKRKVVGVLNDDVGASGHLGDVLTSHGSQLG
jgi:hypothetical protein